MTQTNQNKDYSWLSMILNASKSHLSLAYPDDNPAINELHIQDVTLKGLEEMLRFIGDQVSQAIDEHYIGKGEAGDLNFREEFKKLKDLRNNRFMDEPEFDDLVEQLAADVYAHPTKDGYCCACDADIAFMDKKFTEQEVEQKCLEARIDELANLQRYWLELSLIVPRLQASPPQVKQHIVERLAQLSTNNNKEQS